MSCVDNTRLTEAAEPCIKCFYGLVWLLPEVCYISFPGKACSSFTGSTGTGSRIEKRLVRACHSLESVCVCFGAGERREHPAAGTEK